MDAPRLSKSDPAERVGHRLNQPLRRVGELGDHVVRPTGADYPRPIRILGAIALFASMTNIVSGFLITDRMLKMFKTGEKREGSRS